MGRHDIRQRCWSPKTLESKKSVERYSKSRVEAMISVLGVRHTLHLQPTWHEMAGVVGRGRPAIAAYALSPSVAPVAVIYRLYSDL